MSRTLREPIPVEPFIRWCDDYVGALKAEHDRYPAITSLRGARSIRDAHPTSRPPESDYVAQLIEAIGWDEKNGARRLHRWRHPEQVSKGYTHSGMVERAMIEDAVDSAGGNFDRLYPGLPTNFHGQLRRLGTQRLMTDDQVLAAHVVYVRKELSTTELGGLIYKRFGYASDLCAGRALLHAFRGLGLPLRRCTGSRLDGLRCTRRPKSHSDRCPKHITC